jgi:hypothetical protein
VAILKIARLTHFIYLFFITKHCFSKKVVIKKQTAEIGLKEMRNSVCLSEFDVTATQPHSVSSSCRNTTTFKFYFEKFCRKKARNWILL